MVHHYEYSTINSHHKVLVNLQASNMDAVTDKTKLALSMAHRVYIIDYCFGQSHSQP